MPLIEKTRTHRARNLSRRATFPPTRSVLKRFAELESGGLRPAADLRRQDPIFLLAPTRPCSARRPATSLPIRDVRLRAGAGFVVVLMGEIATMPGLPRVPAAENIRVVEGRIEGLF